MILRKLETLSNEERLKAVRDFESRIGIDVVSVSYWTDMDGEIRDVDVKFVSPCHSQKKRSMREVREMDKLKEPIFGQRTDDFTFNLMTQIVKNFNELFERLESVISRLEDRADNIEGLISSCCPVCQGKGIVPAGFYSLEPIQATATNASPVKCKACCGYGVIGR